MECHRSINVQRYLHNSQETAKLTSTDKEVCKLLCQFCCCRS